MATGRLAHIEAATRTLAHISDLHFGRDAATDAATRALCWALLEADVDEVLLTGDVTHRGRRAELTAFRRAFAPLENRLVVVPGNHDRLGEDAAAALMPGGRVQVERRRGLHVVRLDSTAAHNRRLIDSHGELTAGDIAAVEEAVAGAAEGALVVLMLHHHLLPLPADHLGERLASLLGWPNAAELGLGRDLVDSLRGRCDLVLHGHRHAAGERVLPPRGGRTLRVLNAGSTPALGRVRVIRHAAGRVVSQQWLAIEDRLRLPLVAMPAAA
jgi:3',5'-cyclic-AMP phosphodiesterase